MAPRFRAALLVGRQLTAEDIARFLFENDRAFFRADSEDIVDCLIERTGEVAS